MQRTPDTESGHDRLLVDAILRGDASAFGKLIEKYERLVTSIVYKMTNRLEDKEDLCQDIFLKIYEKLPSFRFGAKLSTWIGNISFNHSVNFLKKKNLLVLSDYSEESNEDGIHQPATDMITDDLQPDDRLISKETRLRIEKEITNLKPVQRTILNLFHQQEFLLEEIAMVMSLPVNTVKSHLYRARTILKSAMQKKDNYGT